MTKKEYSNLVGQTSYAQPLKTKQRKFKNENPYMNEDVLGEKLDLQNHKPTSAFLQQ
jgi:hypothetical protein